MPLSLGEVIGRREPFGVDGRANPVDVGAVGRDLAGDFIEGAGAACEVLRTPAELLLQRLPGVLGLGQRGFPLPQGHAISLQPRLEIERLRHSTLESPDLFGEFRRSRIELRFVLVQPRCFNRESFLLLANFFHADRQ